MSDLDLNPPCPACEQPTYLEAGTESIQDPRYGCPCSPPRPLGPDYPPPR